MTLRASQYQKLTIYTVQDLSTDTVLKVKKPKSNAQMMADNFFMQNREGLLPRQPSGYYREYTVDTPGASNRGARRIVAGQNGELYYTDNHYGSFVRVQFE